MVDLDELRKSAEANKDKVICDPCQKPAEIPVNTDSRMVHLTPSERRTTRVLPRIPRDGLHYPNIHLICVVDDLGVAQFVDPRIAVTPRGLKLRHDSHLGAVSGDC